MVREKARRTQSRINIIMSTFPLKDVPRGRGLTVTVPFKASSRTVAEIVVFIGTPSLLKKSMSQI